MKRFIPMLAVVLCASSYITAQESFNAILGRANNAENSQDWAAAEKAYRQLIADYPESRQISQIVANLALVQSLQGRDSVAIATLDEALAKNESDTLLLERRGQLRMNTDDVAGAMADFGKITEVNPDAFYAFYIHGSLALNSGDTVTAKKISYASANSFPAPKRTTRHGRRTTPKSTITTQPSPSTTPS